MITPCPSRVQCFPCPDQPLANLSSEAPDVQLFYATGYERLIPPLGTNYSALGCVFPVTSFISQEDADLQAALQAILCAMATWTTGTGGDGTPSAPPVPPPGPTPPGPPPPVFFNTDQTGLALCPDGTPYEVDVPAGLFFGRTQAAANTAARTYGDAQAQLHLLCLSDLPFGCFNVDYNETITASSAFLAVSPATNFWEQTGGTLPPGLTFNGGNLGNTATLTGTPTMAGDYTFAIGITLPNGDNQQQEYLMTIAGITNGTSLDPASIGTAYTASLATTGFAAPEFTISDVPLPDGLSMDSAGNITGTPASDAVTTTFPVFVRDTVTNFTCSQDVTIMVTGLNFNQLVWDNPADTANPHNGSLAFTNVGASFHVACGGPALGNNPGPIFSNKATLTYAGADVTTCNLQVTVSGGPFVDSFNGSVHTIWEITLPDGTLIGQGGFPPNDATPAAGVYNFPFTTTAGTVTFTITAVNCSTGINNTCNITIDGVITPNT